MNTKYYIWTVTMIAVIETKWFFNNLIQSFQDHNTNIFDIVIVKIVFYKKFKKNGIVPLAT